MEQKHVRNRPETFDISRKHHLLALKERMDKDISRLEVSLPDWNIPAVPIPLAGLWNFFTIHPLEDRYNLMAFGKRLVTELKRVGKKHTAERYSPEHC